MYLHRGPFWFWWPSRRIGVIRSTSPNLAWPGFHQKPLDATIGRLLAQYRPGSRQGDNQQNNNSKCTHFAGRFNSHHHAAAQYCTHCLMEEWENTLLRWLNRELFFKHFFTITCFYQLMRSSWMLSLLLVLACTTYLTSYWLTYLWLRV